MTTHVIISSPKPNHRRIRVEQGHLEADGKFVADLGGRMPPFFLDDGESLDHLYLFDGRAYLITEAPRPEREAGNPPARVLP